LQFCDLSNKESIGVEWVGKLVFAMLIGLVNNDFKVLGASRNGDVPRGEALYHVYLLRVGEGLDEGRGESVQRVGQVELVESFQ
jgi:hypothetical protein